MRVVSLPCQLWETSSASIWRTFRRSTARAVWALSDLSLRVRPGEIFGLLGPNGAGKSTLVKIMVSVVRPTRASGTILGQPVGHRPTLARIGYLPESHRFPRYLTGRQAIEFFAALSKVDRPTRKRRTAELLETVGMSQWADRRVSEYSKGMMQRVGLAQALATDPDLVILDEPTDGVDPVGRRDIRDVLGRLKAQGKTVFVNSHLLSELEMICDRIAILIGGRVARQGTMNELAAAKQRFEIELAPAAQSNPLSASQRLLLKLAVDITDGTRGKLPGGQWITATDHTVRSRHRRSGPYSADPRCPARRWADHRSRGVGPAVAGRYVSRSGGQRISRGGETHMIQTWALLLDAYRELNAKKLFWITLILSALAVASFAFVGVNATASRWREPSSIFPAPADSTKRCTAR